MCPKHFLMAFERSAPNSIWFPFSTFISYFFLHKNQSKSNFFFRTLSNVKGNMPRKPFKSHLNNVKSKIVHVYILFTFFPFMKTTADCFFAIWSLSWQKGILFWAILKKLWHHFIQCVYASFGWIQFFSFFLIIFWSVWVLLKLNEWFWKNCTHLHKEGICKKHFFKMAFERSAPSSFYS